ncbi:L10-interacting MYB domain-containing protein-like [Magnolia sinica]|uniref:L10-interacting MYB domain-containing protein-like n=1 Tax=Magnolia sinica TaxID=86752 RepID=UPI00265AFF39|nr:L10-interacting MYB domain-containing protein-like [Magnolia sinica]
MTDSFKETSTPTQSTAKTPPVATRCSPRAKTMKSLVEPSSRASKIKWTSAMDQILFDTFLEQVALGRKADNGFKREGYQIAADKVIKHTEVIVTWQNVSNRLRYYKQEYIVVKDMLAASGFGWESERIVVTAPDEVWEQYLRSHPNAVRLRGKRINRMDDLAVICGSDQATGHYIQGSKSMATSTSSSCLQRDLNEAWNSVDDDMDDTIDLSEDYVTDSIGTIPLPSDSPAMGHHGSRGTPTRTPDSNGTR